MPPRTFPAVFVYPLILLCGSGWLLAWRKSGELSTERLAAQESDPATAERWRAVLEGK